MTKKPAPRAPAPFRDQMAAQFAAICMADLSRQLAGMTMPIEDAPLAVKFIATLSYQMADALIEERDRK